jgi:DNA-binding NarL/FixJ family response regulator
MSTLSVREIPSPGALTLVVGGDARTRKATAMLLHAAGLEIAAGNGAWREARAELIVLLVPDGRADMVRDVRLMAEAQPDALIVAVVRADTSNAVLRRVLIAGVAGIVLDRDVDRALAPTVRAILAGQLTVPSALGRQIAPQPLSHREKQVLALVVKGLTNREIAGRLYLAESTVKTHLASAFRKLDARSRSDAVARIQDPETGYGMGVLTSVDPA